MNEDTTQEVTPVEQPMLDIGGRKLPVDSLPSEIKELLVIYQGWTARRAQAAADVDKASATLVTMQREVFLFDAAIKSISDEIGARVAAAVPPEPVAANDASAEE